MSSVLYPSCDAAAARIEAGGLQAAHPRMVLTTTILASSLAFVDGSVVNVGLLAIGQSLQGDAADLQWVINAYLVPLSALRDCVTTSHSVRCHSIRPNKGGRRGRKGRRTVSPTPGSGHGRRRRMRNTAFSSPITNRSPSRIISPCARATTSSTDAVHNLVLVENMVLVLIDPGAAEQFVQRQHRVVARMIGIVAGRLGAIPIGVLGMTVDEHAELSR
jgi:hypothetical protein